jgi:hypothetical protein
MEEILDWGRGHLPASTALHIATSPAHRTILIEHKIRYRLQNGKNNLQGAKPLQQKPEFVADSV